MKILITGCGGMLGTDLATVLSEQHEVYGMGRHEKEHVKHPFYVVDLIDKEAFQKCYQEVEPDLTIHCAAMTNVDGCESEREAALSDNVTATQNVAEVVSALGGFLFFISTDYVFDGKEVGEYPEDKLRNPLNVYGESKALAEQHLIENHEMFSIFRVSWLYGLHGKCFPDTILNLVRERNEFDVVHDQVGRPSFTLDLSRGLGQILDRIQGNWESLKKETFHLANDGKCSWAEFADVILSEAGYNHAQVRRVDSSFYDRPAKRPKNSVLNINKLDKNFGVRLRPWREGLREYLSLRNRRVCDEQD